MLALSEAFVAEKESCLAGDCQPQKQIREGITKQAFFKFVRFKKYICTACSQMCWNFLFWTMLSNCRWVLILISSCHLACLKWVMQSKPGYPLSSVFKVKIRCFHSSVKVFHSSVVSLMGEVEILRPRVLEEQSLPRPCCLSRRDLNKIDYDKYPVHICRFPGWTFFCQADS